MTLISYFMLFPSVSSMHKPLNYYRSVRTKYWQDSEHGARHTAKIMASCWSIEACHGSRALVCRFFSMSLVKISLFLLSLFSSCRTFSYLQLCLLHWWISSPCPVIDDSSQIIKHLLPFKDRNADSNKKEKLNQEFFSPDWILEPTSHWAPSSRNS